MSRTSMTYSSPSFSFTQSKPVWIGTYELDKKIKNIYGWGLIFVILFA